MTLPIASVKPIQASMVRAKAYAEAVIAGDKRFNRMSRVFHDDGSVFQIQNSFTMVDPDDKEFVWLITEHFGEWVFARYEIQFSSWKRLS